MSRELVDIIDGVHEWAHFDDVTGDLTGFERKLDVEPLLEANKSAYSEGLVNKACEFRKVASFDPLTVEIFAKRWGVPPTEVFKNKQLLGRLLADPDLRHFRTLPGRFV